MTRNLWTRTLTIATIGLAVSGCQSTTVADTSCTAFRVITFSAAKDSPETVVQVREHNAAWRKLCT